MKHIKKQDCISKEIDRLLEFYAPSESSGENISRRHAEIHWKLTQLNHLTSTFADIRQIVDVEVREPSFECRECGLQTDEIVEFDFCDGFEDLNFSICKLCT